MFDAVRVARRFSVHGVSDAPSRSLLVEGASFEDAALQFVEDRHIEPDGEELSLMVEDCETGERQCFRVDLETGETAA
jgi:hypothetical protein